MKLLLDTHTFLWFIGDNPKLSAAAKKLLESDVDLIGESKPYLRVLF